MQNSYYVHLKIYFPRYNFDIEITNGHVLITPIQCLSKHTLSVVHELPSATYGIYAHNPYPIDSLKQYLILILSSEKIHDTFSRESMRIFPQTPPHSTIIPSAFLAIMTIIPHISHVQVPITRTCAHPTPNFRTTPPKPTAYKCRFQTRHSDHRQDRKMEAVDAADLRSQFLQVLRSRRSSDG